MSNLNGAQVLVKCLEKQGVEYVFGHPGGAAINIFDALLDSKIKFILTRHEQGATHMADGYARASGKLGVVLVTSGPGALNTVTGIATARMDSVPILVISGQTNKGNLGKDAFQESDVFGVTMPLVKHSYLILESSDIPRVIKEAHHIATTGRPGPVLIDLPKDVSNEDTELDLEAKMDLPGYVVHDKSPSLSLDQKGRVQELARHLMASKKPLLLIGHGALIAGASSEIRHLAETLGAPVTNTLLGKGAFPESHPLSLGMLGMHGTAYANYALTECDLILSIGSRFDDRINGNNEEFCRGAKKLHIDIDQAEINKIVQVDAAVCGDAKLVLKELSQYLEPLKTAPWLSQLADYRRENPLLTGGGDGLTAASVIKGIYEKSKDFARTIVTTDVGQHQMWAAQHFLTDDPDCFLSSGGAGTMGFGFPSAIGAQLAKKDSLVITFCGDGGFQMTLCELATAVVHRLPLKIVVLDNACLGMVRQWQELFYDERYSGIDLEGNPDFASLAESYGMKAFVLEKESQIATVLEAALSYDAGPCLIHAKINRKENVFPMIPAGKSAKDIVLRAPTVKLEKPIGST